MTTSEAIAIAYSFSIWLTPNSGIDMPNPTDWEKGEHICLENHGAGTAEVTIGITKANGVSIELPPGVVPCPDKKPIS